MHALRDADGAVVAVVHRGAEQRAVGVEQAVVDGPGVDADAVHLARLTQSGEDLAVEPDDVPVQGVADAHRAVAEAVHLGELETCRPAHPRPDDPPGRGAEVDGGDGDAVGGRAHRRKAAATPASTGMCRPVVCDRSAEQSTKTALATFSGSTSRLRRVRWA